MTQITRLLVLIITKKNLFFAIFNDCLIDKKFYNTSIAFFLTLHNFFYIIFVKFKNSKICEYTRYFQEFWKFDENSNDEKKKRRKWWKKKFDQCYQKKYLKFNFFNKYYYSSKKIMQKKNFNEIKFLLILLHFIIQFSQLHFQF